MEWVILLLQKFTFVQKGSHFLLKIKLFLAELRSKDTKTIVILLMCNQENNKKKVFAALSIIIYHLVSMVPLWPQIKTGTK